MAEIDRKRLAGLIAARLKATGLTQRQAADKAGVGLRQMNHALHGRTVGAGNVLMLADWLCIDPYMLIDVPGAPPDAGTAHCGVPRGTHGETRGAS